MCAQHTCRCSNAVESAANRAPEPAVPVFEMATARQRLLKVSTTACPGMQLAMRCWCCFHAHRPSSSGAWTRQRQQRSLTCRLVDTCTLRCSTHLQEYKEVVRSGAGDTGITLIPSESNLFIWRALLKVCAPAGYWRSRTACTGAAAQPAFAQPHSLRWRSRTACM